MKSIKDYYAAIGAALAKGDATEHTHRPALKAIIESLRNKITATNEPKRIACGAPDFVVSGNDLTIGYVEAKDIGVSLDEAMRTDQLKRYVRHAYALSSGAMKRYVCSTKELSDDGPVT